MKNAIFVERKSYKPDCYRRKEEMGECIYLSTYSLRSGNGKSIKVYIGENVLKKLSKNIDKYKVIYGYDSKKENILYLLFSERGYKLNKKKGYFYCNIPLHYCTTFLSNANIKMKKIDVFEIVQNNENNQTAIKIEI